MNVLSLEHQPSEGPGKIADWAKARGHRITSFAVYEKREMPTLDSFELLVIMGGSMNVYQYRDHPWLRRERIFIADAIRRGKPVLGICLGAQLIADVLGAKVYQNDEKEIGWLPATIFDRAAPFGGFPEKMTVMHWHGDTFDTPPGARRVAESAGCTNQGFVFGDRVVGLQFHLEQTAVTVGDLAAACLGDLTPGRFVQSREQLLVTPPDLDRSHAALFSLLDELATFATTPHGPGGQPTA